jgi:hypothetical protein
VVVKLLSFMGNLAFTEDDDHPSQKATSPSARRIDFLS